MRLFLLFLYLKNLTLATMFAWHGMTGWAMYAALMGTLAGLASMMIPYPAPENRRG